MGKKGAMQCFWKAEKAEVNGTNQKGNTVGVKNAAGRTRAPGESV